MKEVKKNGQNSKVAGLNNNGNIHVVCSLHELQTDDCYSSSGFDRGLHRRYDEAELHQEPEEVIQQEETSAEGRTGTVGFEAVLDFLAEPRLELEDGLPFFVVMCRAYTGKDVFNNGTYLSAWRGLTVLSFFYMIYAVYHFILWAEKVPYNGTTMALGVWTCMAIIFLIGPFWKR